MARPGIKEDLLVRPATAGDLSKLVHLSAARKTNKLPQNNDLGFARDTHFDALPQLTRV